MKTILYKAETRGHAQHGWLNAHHTFSFANYYDPERIHFGALRVLNDDVIDGGKGFGTHPHDNMEIITIPLTGSLRHEDSMGNGGVIESGDIQVMTAGTGIQHSEFNAQKDKPVNLFQIWVFPNKKNVTPRYEQKTLDFLNHKNSFQLVVSPTPTEQGLWIHQDAWFSIGSFDKGVIEKYELKSKSNGVFAMVIQGSFNVSGTVLDNRDGLGIWDTESLTIESLSDDARILLMEVPMEF
ncbi:pirin family protein [Dysgonomonas sp. HGC4]|uniref:pirin family protein n=1 Tax=Dysgonomonas sp. HGC4 TaxID=1658009 RepID=UPI0006803579|nr:pirin family protein [Dysgonomonas sp. HGC4]MBD8349421.1 pirin family protein [Dysgonomonas sp. HGC4]